MFVEQNVVPVPRLHTHILLALLEPFWDLHSLLDTRLPSGDLSSDLTFPLWLGTTLHVRK